MTKQQEATKPKILIVEDEVIIALDLKSHLEKMGYIVSAQVNSAEKALEMIEQDPPDLVLMDIVLAGKMDGIEAADIIRSRWDIPVVFCTAYADQERLGRAKLVYPFGYILKPFQDNDVRVTVEMALYVSKTDKERRKAEEALLENEERFRSLYEQAPLGYQSLDAQGCLIEVNQSWLDLLGYARQEVIGRRFSDFLPPQEVEAFKQRFPNFKANGVVHVDLEMVQRAGSKIIVHIDGRIGRDEHGQFKQTHCILHDITERKQVEEKLRESEERYRRLFEEAMDGIILADQTTGTILDCNKAITDLMEREKHEIIGKLQKILHPPEDSLGDVSVTFEQHRHDKKGQVLETRVITKTGKIRDVEIKASAFHLHGRDVMQGIFHDITDRKLAEMRLRESEERYRSLASAEDSMYLVDRECRFRFMNNTYHSRFSIAIDEIIGRSYGEFHSEKDSRQFAGLVKEVFERNTSLQIEYQSEREPKYFLRTLSPVRDPQGSVTAVTVISKDITERKNAQKAFFKSEKLYRSLFENMLNGFAYCKMLFKEGQPEDFIYLAVNRAFEAQTELKNVAGKKVSEVIPGGRESDPQLFEIYGRVSLTGNPERLEFYLKALKQWFSLSVYSPEKEYFVVVFDVITERKHAEKKLLQYQQQLQSLSIRLSEVEETERKEIARTLHDLVGQNLTALNLNLTIILGMLSGDQNPLLVSRLEDSQKLLEETTQYIRDVMSALRPSVLDDFGLTAALRWYGRRFNEMTGIQTNLEEEYFSPRLPSFLETNIFRIAQEALTNVLKHASAEKVDLRIEKVEDKVRLTITDDGQGFIFKGFRLGGAKRGWGLAMMRERAVALGGDLQIYTEPGKGTRIILELPFNQTRD